MVTTKKGWNFYSGSFATKPDTDSGAIGFGLGGRDRKWGPNPPVPIDSELYIDDVLIHEEKKTGVTKRPKLSRMEMIV